MTLPVSIAEKLLLLAQGQQLPASGLKHSLIDELKEEGIILERLSGRTKSNLYVSYGTVLHTWVHNKFAISDLQAYISVAKNADATRAELIEVSNDSKAAARRAFRGFLVNSYMPIDCTLSGAPFVIYPQQGSFQFIYETEHFNIPQDAVIVGLENFENFRSVEKLRHLFGDNKTLFVSRYPQEQSKDLLRWLQSVQNQFVYMGDYDFAGVNIYQQEYKKHLKERASFYVPGNIEELIEKFGNRKLYDSQRLNDATVSEPAIKELISLIHKHKKGLEQEILLTVK